MNYGLQGKNALITGAAGGFGSALARVLDGAGIEYKILSDKTAAIFGETSVTALAEALRRENCELYSMKERDESLESYYMSLVGGDRRA